MSVFSGDAKDTMLDALTADEVQLHDGDPGASGTANRIGDENGVEAATFAAASGGERALAEQVDFTGLDASQSVTWFSVWTAGTSTFLGKGELSGDLAANAAGEISLTTATKLILDDPV